MIVVDDLRPEIASFGTGGTRVPPFAGMHTPHIDRFAETAATFRSAFVQQAVCGASRASFLTGRRVETTRVYDLTSDFRDVGGDFVTIPQHFAEAGYISRGFGKIFHPTCGRDKSSIGECDPVSWTEPYFHSPEEQYYTCTVKLEQKGLCTHVPSHYSVPAAEEAAHPLPDTQIKDEAVAELSRYQELAPSSADKLFLAVGFHKPHLPFVVPERFVDLYPLETVDLAPNRFAPAGMPDVAWSGAGELMSWADIADLDLARPSAHYGNQLQPNNSFPERMERELRQHYFAAVSYTDDNIGQVLDAAASDPSTRDAIVVIFGDHGW
jgi:iduronate 2-sulfatase